MNLIPLMNKILELTKKPFVHSNVSLTFSNNGKKRFVRYLTKSNKIQVLNDENQDMELYDDAETAALMINTALSEDTEKTPLT